MHTITRLRLAYPLRCRGYWIEYQQTTHSLKIFEIWPGWAGANETQTRVTVDESHSTRVVALDESHSTRVVDQTRVTVLESLRLTFKVEYNNRHSINLDTFDTTFFCHLIQCFLLLPPPSPPPSLPLPRQVKTAPRRRILRRSNCRISCHLFMQDLV